MRPVEAREDLDGAVLVSRTGSRRWRARRHPQNVFTYILAPLTPSGKAVSPEATRASGLQPIKRTRDELHTRGWCRVD